MGCRPKRPFAEWITASMTCAMADRMQEFVEVFHAQLRSRSGGEIICVDGKAEQGHSSGERAKILCRHFSFNTGITLATEACQEKQ